MAKWLILLALLGACGAPEVAVDDEDPGAELGIERVLSCKEAGSFACGAWLKGEHITWRCSGPSVEEVRAHQKAWAGSGPLCRADDIPGEMVELDRPMVDAVRAPAPDFCGLWVNEDARGALTLLLWWPANKRCP